LKAFCFGAIPDIMIELMVYKAVLKFSEPWKGAQGAKPPS
jgi:hypothetical protein